MTKAKEQVHGHGWGLGGGRAPVATDRETRNRMTVEGSLASELGLGVELRGFLQFCEKIRLKGSEKE